MPNRCFPRCGAGVLSFASPKESSQRKGDPRVGARCAGPLRYSVGRAAAQLGAAPLKQCSPKAPGQPALLSASQGEEKRRGGTALPGKRQKGYFVAVDRWKTAKTIPTGSAATPFRVPMWSAEQRVAQGSRRSRPRSLGSPFLCLLSFGEAKESETPRKGGTQSPNKDNIPRNRDEKHQGQENRYKTKVDRPENSPPTHELPAPEGGH